MKKVKFMIGYTFDKGNMLQYKSFSEKINAKIEKAKVFDEGIYRCIEINITLEEFFEIVDVMKSCGWDTVITNKMVWFFDGYYD